MADNKSTGLGGMNRPWLNTTTDKIQNGSKNNPNNSFMGGGKGKNKTTDWTTYGPWAWFAQWQLGDNERNKFGLGADGGVYRNQYEFFLLANPKTGQLDKLWAARAQDFRADFGNSKITPPGLYVPLLIKAGMLPSNYKVTKNPSKQYIDALMAASTIVSEMNFSRFGNGEKGKTVGKPLTLAQGLREIAKMGGADAAGGGGGTYISQSFMSFSDAEARGILESFYATSLGRRPSAKEVSNFKDVINAEAKKRPSVTKNVSSGNTTTSTSNEGYSQADAELKAREMAEAKPGANSFITSTKYMDTFLSVLGGKVGRI